MYLYRWDISFSSRIPFLSPLFRACIQSREDRPLLLIAPTLDERFNWQHNHRPMHVNLQSMEKSILLDKCRVPDNKACHCCHLMASKGYPLMWYRLRHLQESRKHQQVLETIYPWCTLKTGDPWHSVVYKQKDVTRALIGNKIGWQRILSTLTEKINRNGLKMTNTVLRRRKALKRKMKTRLANKTDTNDPALY